MRTLVCYICHFQNDESILRYNILKESLPDNFDILFVAPTECENTNNINNFICLNLKDNFFKYCDSKYPKNEQTYINVYRLYNDYDFYWFIEYDVIFGRENKIDKWNKFFNTFKYNISDLICSHINNYNKKYMDSSYPIESLIEFTENDNIIKSKNNIIRNNLYFGFLPICRISNKLLSIVTDYYSNYYNFFEFTIPSLAKYNNLQILDLDNTHYSQFKYYITKNPHWKINCGSISWYKEDKRIYDDNVLIHPVKI